MQCKAFGRAMVLGMISLLLGAFSPSRRTAAMLATGVVITSYPGSNLTGTISALGPVRNLFLFYYCEATAEALEQGQQAGNTLILLAVAMVASGAAVGFFQRRNLTVGAWPWQRGRIPEASQQ